MLQSRFPTFQKEIPKPKDHEVPLRVQAGGVHGGKSIVKGAISGLALSYNAWSLKSESTCV